MKRTILIFVAISLVFIISSCGEADQSKPNQYSETVSSEAVSEEKVSFADASYVITWNEANGEFLGIENERLYIYDGNSKREYSSGYEVVMTLGKTQAVKYNDSVYGLVQNGKPVRLYETDFEHESAALEYCAEFEAILVGGDAIYEIVNRYGEIISVNYFTNFKASRDGLYIMTACDTTPFEMKTILDFETMKPVAHLCCCYSEYEFTKDNMLLVRYVDYENSEEMVEFEIPIGEAIETLGDFNGKYNCNCFKLQPPNEVIE